MIFGQLILTLQAEFHTLPVDIGHARNSINGTEF